MIAAIRRMLLMIQGNRVTPEELAKIGKTYDFRIALAALLVHAANVDGKFVEPEKLHVRRLLVEQLGISAIDAGELMILVNYKYLQQQEIEELVATLADTLGLDGRVHFVEWLWEVVVSDRIVTAEETGLIETLATKLGVDEAAQKAVARKFAKTGVA